jgi:hypothetical protein
VSSRSLIVVICSTKRWFSHDVEQVVFAFWEFERYVGSLTVKVVFNGETRV